MSLPTTYEGTVSFAIVGGTGLGALPSPPFQPIARLPPTKTPWGEPSSPITILSYQTNKSGKSGAENGNALPKPLIIAFLARHGLHHNIAPHEINNRANVAALKKLGVRAVLGFSAVGSLREQVKPRDFVVAGGVVDWTKGVRPWTFFDDGVVGHISMADPFDKEFSRLVHKSIAQPGVLHGDDMKVHEGNTVICIEGPQFSTRAESLLYRSFDTEPPISCINMSAVPEYKLFREAEISYALICMSTDYDCWHGTNEGVSVEMVMGHMAANSGNAKRAVEAVLETLSLLQGDAYIDRVAAKWQNASRGGLMGLPAMTEDGPDSNEKGRHALKRLTWLFGEDWVRGSSTAKH